MKTKCSLTNLHGILSLLVIAYFIIGTGNADGQTESTNTSQSAEDNVVAMIHSLNYDHSTTTAGDWGWGTLSSAKDSRQKTIQSLLGIFNDPKSYIFRPKCYAAYYLGIMRASEAVNSLAAQITIQGAEHGLEAPIGGYEPAVDALIAIGSPSIPAVVRNLAESDDAKVRELSLKVILKIDNDKDISQFRLEKALKKETDSQKQARLQAALNSLAEMK